MADNVTIPASGTGTATPVVAAEDRSSVFYQRNTGNAAHGDTQAGYPFAQAATSIAHGTNPTAVDAGDQVRVLANRAGIPFGLVGHPNILTYRLRWTTTQTDISLVGTISAGTKVVLVGRPMVTIDEATTVGVAVRVGFGATTTPSNSSTSGVVLDHDGIVPGGGIAPGDDGIFIGGDGEELRITAEAPTSGSGIILGRYFTIES